MKKIFMYFAIAVIFAIAFLQCSSSNSICPAYSSVDIEQTEDDS